MNQEELKKRQAWSLPKKIAETEIRIVEWYLAFDGQVYISFSGGKDSTVLVDLVHGLFPDVPLLFNNTGLEYPEIIQFVRSFEDVIETRPSMPFHQIVKKYGYPIISKKVARQIHDLQNPTPRNEATRNLYLTGIKQDGTLAKSNTTKLPQKWRYLIDAPFKIHNICCDILKKTPIKKYEKETGRRAYIGTMASDSDTRETVYLKQGCNAFDKKQPSSQPLSFWTEQDIWGYINQKSLSYCSVYDMGIRRTGCMFCMFGITHEQKHGTNRFLQMQQTHPKQHKYCIEKLGCGYVLDYIGVPHTESNNGIEQTPLSTQYKQMELFN
uniref:Putative phosphoadenosine phosphosulfate n=1 Tax=viral metagenome TaxID=1070528 RepID=A0A6H1ZKU5_9ZZZZ